MTDITRFRRFLLVGLIGFVVDASLLHAFYAHFAFTLTPSRLFSFGAACFVTWLCNRLYTFQPDGKRPKFIEYSRYFGVQVTGAGINLAVFVVLVGVNPYLERIPLIPLSVGAGVAFIFNFLGSRYFVFRSDGR